jgi:ribonuclease-3
VPHGLPDVLVDLPPVDLSNAATASQLDRVQGRLDYSFSRVPLLRVALTVGSWANENRSAGWASNACLEFFGDAVLDLAAAHALWRRFPTLAEGALTRLRSTLVSEQSLAQAARDIDLGASLWVGKGDEPGGRERDGTLADAFEAVLGAVYLDAGSTKGEPMAAAGAVFGRVFGAKVAAMTPDDGLDPKSRLQQRIQGQFKRTPRYEPIGDPPPPQDPHWVVRVVMLDEGGGVRVLGQGEGRSLRAAERAAAEDALRGLGLSS